MSCLSYHFILPRVNAAIHAGRHTGQQKRKEPDAPLPSAPPKARAITAGPVAVDVGGERLVTQNRSMTSKTVKMDDALSAKLSALLRSSGGDNAVQVRTYLGITPTSWYLEVAIPLSQCTNNVLSNANCLICVIKLQTPCTRKLEGAQTPPHPPCIYIICVNSILWNSQLKVKHGVVTGCSAPPPVWWRIVVVVALLACVLIWSVSCGV